MTNVGLRPGTFDRAALPAADLAFPRGEYARRLETLCDHAARAGIDLLWLTTPDAVCWLHGFLASWYKANSPMRYPQCYGTAVHPRSRRFIHFDNPTEEPILALTSVSADNRFLPSREGAENIRFIMAELSKEGWLGGAVGLEMWSYVPNRAIGAMFERAFRAEGCSIVDGSAVSRRARRVKSPLEIATIEKAMAVCDVAHDTIRANLKPGISELDLFGRVTAAMMAAGGEFPALIPIFNAAPLANGWPQQTGHGMAGRRIIEAGDILTADLCGVWSRYHANAMRSYFVGAKPPPKLVEQYKRSAGVFEVIRTEIRAGMTVADVNRRLRRYYDECGLWTETNGWALGYELGLSLPPDWVGDFYFHLGDTTYLDRVFEPNMVTNFESLFDTGLIDTIVYGERESRVLSRTPLELIAVG